ncbi:MAG: 4-phosphoerythronate dehydrogenase [Kiritimatiellia bacterium]
MTVKIVCDKNMPYAFEAFSTIGDVTLIPGRDISRKDVRDAEVLVTRSTTNVNADLLEGSSVRFYGSAVIGVDHIDSDYLHKAGIEWAAAPGCNAVSVGNYVTAALLWLGERYGFGLEGKTIGVIGVGNVGKQVCRFCRAMGMRVLANDPPRQRNTNDADARDFVSLDTLLNESDFISCHVPLNKGGDDNTVHLIGAEQLASMKDGVVLINAARGAVVDNQALLDVIGKKVSHAVIDCWEGEPAYRADVMAKVDLGTPHIAGHAYEGKVNGTAMTYRAACEFMGVNATYPFELPRPPVPVIRTDAAGRNDEDVLRDLVLEVYDIQADSDRLRSATEEDVRINKTAFDSQRGTYPMRRQFDATRVEIINSTDFLLKKIRGLDFKVEPRSCFQPQPN